MEKANNIITIILIWATVLLWIIGILFIADFDIMAYIPSLIVSVFLVLFAILATSVIVTLGGKKQ